MNTGQLIVLWYAGLVMIGLITLHQTTGSAMAAIALFAGLLIYSLKPHPSARKGWVFAVVGAPVVGIPLILFAYQSYNARVFEQKREREASLIRVEQLEFARLDLHRDEVGGRFRLTGRVRNRSTYVLQGVDVEISVFDDGEKIEATSASIEVRVSPGEARDFEARVFLRSEFKEWTPRPTDVSRRVPPSKSAGKYLYDVETDRGTVEMELDRPPRSYAELRSLAEAELLRRPGAGQPPVSGVSWQYRVTGTRGEATDG